MINAATTTERQKMFIRSVQLVPEDPLSKVVHLLRQENPQQRPLQWYNVHFFFGVQQVQMVYKLTKHCQQKQKNTHTKTRWNSIYNILPTRFKLAPFAENSKPKFSACIVHHRRREGCRNIRRCSSGPDSLILSCFGKKLMSILYPSSTIVISGFYIFRYTPTSAVGIGRNNTKTLL